MTLASITFGSMHICVSWLRLTCAQVDEVQGWMQKKALFGTCNLHLHRQPPPNQAEEDRAGAWDQQRLTRVQLVTAPATYLQQKEGECVHVDGWGGQGSSSFKTE